MCCRPVCLFWASTLQSSEMEGVGCQEKLLTCESKASKTPEHRIYGYLIIHSESLLEIHGHPSFEMNISQNSVWAPNLHLQCMKACGVV